MTVDFNVIIQPPKEATSDLEVTITCVTRHFDILLCWFVCVCACVHACVCVRESNEKFKGGG